MLDFISMVHTLEKKDIQNEANAFHLYLSIKWILCELVDTLKVPRVGLLHSQAILAPFENFDLISGVEAGANKAALLLHIHPGAPLPTHSKPSCLLLVRVVVDDQRQPQSLDVVLGQCVCWKICNCDCC